MKKILITGITAAAVLLTGCGEEGKDRQGSNGADADRITDVDSAEVFRNIDNFPNIERVCVDGIAFAATRSHNDTESVGPNLIRVPEWDGKCGSDR